MTNQQLIDLFEGLGYTVRDDYSGRGMYGDTCIAVTLDRDENQTSVQLVIDVMLDILDQADTLDEAYDSAASMGQLFSSYEEDSMGCDSVLYFPRRKTNK